MPPRIHSTDTHLVKRFEVFSQVAAAVAVLTGSATFLGWAFRIEALKSILPGQVAMKPNAAVGFILCGVALWCLAVPATVGLRPKIGRACASLAALVGLLTLGEYVFRLNFGIDQLLFIEEAGAIGTYSPGRMAPLAALSFILIGVALLLLDVETPRGLRPAQLGVLPVVAVSILAVLEYWFAIPAYFGIATFMRMAVHGAVAFIMLCAGILCVRPDRGLMTVATSDAQGGAMWRRLLPVAFLIPVLLGWLRLQGQRAGHFGTEMGVVLFATSLAVVLVSLIWWYAKSLDRADCERRRMEDQTRASYLHTRSLIEASLDPLVTISGEGKITDVNRATELVTGVPRQRLIGSDFSDYFTEPERARAGYQQVFREGSVQDYALEILHQNGHITPVLYNATVFKNEAGDIQGIFAAARDITERKRAEDDLKRSNAELQQFAYVASHDLQEPLRMVASYTELLGQRYRGKLDTDADEFIGFAVDGAKRMQKIIEDLLEYSRVGTRGKEPRLCDSRQIVQRALKNLSVAVKESGAVVQVAKLPPIRCDEIQIEKVFQNLIGNAIKFREKDRPCLIEVSARQEGRNWVFCIKDNGIGIETRHFERIFQIFQRLHTREEYPGTGIGLTICRKIVERHAGRIWLESQPGAGAAFFFTIPFAAAEKTEEVISATSAH